MSRGKKFCCFGVCNSSEKKGAPGYDPATRFYRFPQPCLLLRNNIFTWSYSEESLHVDGYPYGGWLVAEEQTTGFGEFVKFQPTSTSAQSISTKNRTRWITPNVYRMVTQTW
ncbi:hypothetical protein GE061_011352 [Apolygus lucorum]|uniref:Uncharacterized protein n=1 Tax=Apolygus lucorum TaxID=248454 RepID=A0A8S9XZ80_APOLU|nr:hypothetical protein GE061_011352 [Apolygus lucorum]